MRAAPTTMWRSPAAPVCLLVAAVLLSAVAAATAGEEYVKYKDPKKPIGERVDDLLSRMTLAEKIGQMTQIERQVASPQVLKDYFIGEHCSSSETQPSAMAAAAAAS